MGEEDTSTSSKEGENPEMAGLMTGPGAAAAGGAVAQGQSSKGEQQAKRARVYSKLAEARGGDGGAGGAGAVESKVKGVGGKGGTIKSRSSNTRWDSGPLPRDMNGVLLVQLADGGIGVDMKGGVGGAGGPGLGRAIGGCGGDGGDGSRSGMVDGTGGDGGSVEGPGGLWGANGGDGVVVAGGAGGAGGAGRDHYEGGKYSLSLTIHFCNVL